MSAVALRVHELAGHCEFVAQHRDHFSGPETRPLARCPARHLPAPGRLHCASGPLQEAPLAAVGATFFSLHLLFDKHAEAQTAIVDALAERIQAPGGVCIAMAQDVAALTRIERPPRGREEVPVQISRLLEAHEHVLISARALARKAAELGDDGTSDLLVSEVVRPNEAQIWFVSEHVVDTPLVRASRED